MDKSKFLFLLVNNSSLSPDETEALQVLQDEFPYSQAIHNLVARGSHLNDLPVKQTKLNKAAVYATDRAILKAMVIAPAGKRTKNETPPAAPIAAEGIKKAEEPKSLPAESIQPKEKPLEKVVESKIADEKVVTQPAKKETPLHSVAETTAKEEFTPSKLSGDELLDELFHDLEKLKKLKHGFEVASANFNSTPSVSIAPPSNPAAEVKEDSKPIKKPKAANKGIIAEIKSTKKKIKPSDPKQKEQLDIIDRFIKSKPSIPKGKTSSSAPPATDLSEGSSVFTDNIVSETLVEILIKQGKKEKAIEVLRKLIWKFPQKKAYFAAQIEELTN
ncbi:MAG: hypothetical protein RH948_02595 [Cyclobacteriaceae bacterium]